MTWDWTQVSRIIGEHSTHMANSNARYQGSVMNFNLTKLVQDEAIFCLKQ